MSAHRFFVAEPLPAPDAQGSVRLPLSASDLHHLRDVVRIREGEVVEVVEPAGDIVSVRIAGADAEAILAVVISRRQVRADAAQRLTLVQGVAKGDKMDAIVRQAVEVGATRIVPVLFERCVVRLDDRKRVERRDRWQRIALSAAKQAHRSAIPSVSTPVTLAELPLQLADVGHVIVLWEEEEGKRLTEVLADVSAHAEAALVIGPEGGLSDREVEQLRAEGAITASLGPYILRTETAAIAALALAVDSLGRHA